MAPPASGGTLRAGFHLDAKYCSHSTPVRDVVFNNLRGLYTSTDEKGMQTWRVGKEQGTTEEVAYIAHPPRTTCFITSIVFSEELSLYFASALDSTLKVYDQELNLETSLFWGGVGVVLKLLYNPELDEIISAGKDGIRFWKCSFDVKAATAHFRDNLDKQQDKERKNLLDEKKEKDMKDAKSYVLNRGKMCSWRGGVFSSLKERYRIPPSALSSAERPWVEQIEIDIRRQKLYVTHERSVFIFDLEDGSRLAAYQNIHPKQITSILVIPEKTMLISCCRSSVIKFWGMRPNGTLQMLETMGPLTKPVVRFCGLPQEENSILMFTEEGFVHLIDLETLEPLHRMKLPKPIAKADMIDETTFFVQTEFEIHVFALVHLHHTFAQYNSSLTALACVGNGKTLCAHEDSGIRLVGNDDAETLSTTVPALSRFSLQSFYYDVSQDKLYVMLTNGHIHVYSCDTNPSTNQEIFNSLIKCKPLCMAHCAERPPQPKPGTTTRFTLLPSQSIDHKLNGIGFGGLWPDAPDEVLAVGTEEGDVIFLDPLAHGSSVHTFPAHRNRPVSQLVYNYARKILVTCALKCLRIWRMTSHDLMAEVNYPDMITCIDQFMHTLIIGLKNGSVRTINLNTLEENALPIEGGHSASVAAIAVSELLGQFVTCCSGGMLKVFIPSKRIEYSLQLEQPISCICYQDSKGNLLAGLGDKLVRIRAKVLEFAPNELGDIVQELPEFQMTNASVMQTPSSRGGGGGREGASTSAVSNVGAFPSVQKKDTTIHPHHDSDEEESAEIYVPSGEDVDEEAREKLLHMLQTEDLPKISRRGRVVGSVVFRHNMIVTDTVVQDEARKQEETKIEPEVLPPTITQSPIVEVAKSDGKSKKKKKKKTKKKRIISRDPAIQLGLLEIQVSEQTTSAKLGMNSMY